jgi:acyl-CoA reductase-like NAD-dependent aldehyde dehydrogenase
VNSDHPHALLLAGQWLETDDVYDVVNPYNGTPVGRVCRASPDHLERAIQSAVQAAPATRALPAYRRADILHTVAQALESHAEPMARTIAQEAAKPINQARAEVQRSIFTIAQAAQEATRIPGETLTLDANPTAEGRHGFVRRFPIGPIAAITPFNFPLNLVAHKLAPALAAGCPVVLKPASQTPLSALHLARMITDAGYPPGGLSVLPMPGALAAPLVEDACIKLLTFTGSPAVGWAMKQRAGTKRVMLELGGNAGVIVHEDADLAYAAGRIVTGAFSYAGQSCISVQRVLVHHQVYKKFMSLFIPAVQALKVGDPLDETSDLSVVISPAEGERVAAWLDEARAAGAQVVTGGQVQDNTIAPTVLTNAAHHLRVNCQEIFAPVVTVEPYTSMTEALDTMNDSDYGLQAGVFTNTLSLAWQAYEALEVGGVMINDVPTWRVDHMPYGGVKQSGLGREGVRYAIVEMTEPRLLVFNMREP